MLSVFDCAKVEIYFRYTLEMLFKDHKILIISDVKTLFRLNIKKNAL